ncbi:MAG: adenylate/guanylate cyclase domain-containing protein [Acidobacteriota bacterium]
MATLDMLFEWLVDGAPGATPPEIADRLGRDIAGSGIALMRLGVFVTTIHPNVAGRAFIWERGKVTRVAELTYETAQSVDFQHSPIARCANHNREWRWRAGEPDHGYQAIRDFAARGCVDYVCFPLPFVKDEVQVLSIACDRPLADAELESLRRIARPLARLAEIWALRRTATTILNTYVGAISGERVLAGRILRGDIETIRAAIWFSDLRGFTAASETRPPREIITIINDVFECQVPAIARHGGEVLKFIGDGLLAIFPIAEGERAACNAALAAAHETLAALAALNAERASSWRIGLALHVGEIAYGNIGSTSRLDFTAIGSAINTAARLEGTASKLGRAVVLSEPFAALADGTFDDLGSHELKGIAEPQRVYGLPGESQPR